MQADISLRLAPSPSPGSTEFSTRERLMRAEGQYVVYDGELGELSKLFFTNLGLSLVTLGFYRFWGKTNIRRYIWSHIVVQDERLEYLGTGRELLLGFLKTVAFVVLLVLVNQLIPEIMDLQSGIGMAAALASSASFGLLYLAAQFAAQRYRLSRTSWCAIRGGMDGSAWKFAFKAGALFLVSALLIGLLIPWWRMVCLETRVNASRFGSMRASLVAGRSICFWSFMLGVATLSAINFGFDPIINEIAHLPYDEDILQALFLLCTVLSVAVFAPIAFAVYFANVQHEFFNHLQVGDLGGGQLRFVSLVTPGAMLWQLTSAVGLLVLTLGLAWPVVLHRWIRFTAGNIKICGMIHADSLRQATDAMPKTSEGLLEALDPGIL